MVGVERERHDAGVVDQDVDAPEPVDGMRSGGADLVPVGHVADVWLERAPLGADRARRRLQPFRGDVDSDDLRSKRGGQFGDPPAKATACAGDDDDLAVHVVRHAGHTFQTTLRSAHGGSPSSRP